MDRDFIERLKDYFSPCELVELFDDDISTEDVIHAFEDVIEDNADLLTEYMDHGR